MKRNRTLNQNPWLKVVISSFVVALIYVWTVTAQGLNGSNGVIPEKWETGNTADKNLRSLAKVNPSTLALEMSLPLMSYPGRNGNNLLVDFRYSSKVWRLKDVTTWFDNNGSEQLYITDVYPLYAERSAGGWTSSLVPPRIDEEQIVYNDSGHPYSAWIGDAQRFTNEYLAFLGHPHEIGYVCLRWARFNPWDGWQCTLGYDDYDEGFPGVLIPDGSGNPNNLHYVKRQRVVMPDGSSHEFRQNDSNAPFNGGTFQSPTPANLNGIFLAVDGSGMTLDHHEPSGYTLRLPNGGYYEFPNEAQSEDGLYATSFTDVNGNRMTYHETSNSPGHEQIWTDTLGRQITDPIPHNWLAQAQQRATPTVNLPGMNGATQQYQLTWDNLKPVGCEDHQDDPGCTVNNISGGALENQSEKLYYSAPNACEGGAQTNLGSEVLFPDSGTGIRSCNEFAIISSPDGHNTAVPVRFNPVVLSKITLPNGQSYEFKYNRYGEISKITYPTGSFETFVYGVVTETGGFSSWPHSRTNRGVIERKVFAIGETVPTQVWKYHSDDIKGSPTNYFTKITTTQSRANNIAADGLKTETYLHVRYPDTFGYSDPRAGMPFDELAYDENDHINPRSRVLTEYVTKNTLTGWDGLTAHSDLRVARKVAIIFEPGSANALATLSETTYDENNPNALPSNFPQLNVKSQKSYHYRALNPEDAKTQPLGWLVNHYNLAANPASVTETDYLYNEAYEARGITSLPFETRILDPGNGSVIARTQTFYDNLLPYVPESYPDGYSI